VILPIQNSKKCFRSSIFFSVNRIEISFIEL
jgi:hypothetical protein